MLYVTSSRLLFLLNVVDTSDGVVAFISGIDAALISDVAVGYFWKRFHVFMSLLPLISDIVASDTIASYVSDKCSQSLDSFQICHPYS